MGVAGVDVDVGDMVGRDGSAAVTVRQHGKGKAFAVGTLAGNTYMKTGVKAQPWPRAGRKSVYTPVAFDGAVSPAAERAASGVCRWHRHADS